MTHGTPQQLTERGSMRTSPRRLSGYSTFYRVSVIRLSMRRPHTVRADRRGRLRANDDEVRCTVFERGALPLRDRRDRRLPARCAQLRPRAGVAPRPPLGAACGCRQVGGADIFGSGRALRVRGKRRARWFSRPKRRGTSSSSRIPDDRRSIQVALTASGRLKLQRRRLPPSDWTFDLLGGVLSESMRTRRTCSASYGSGCAATRRS